MSLFPLSKNKDNSDYTKDRVDLRLAQYKEVLKTSMQLSQLQNQSEEMLLILEEMRQKGSDWSQVQEEEVQNQGRIALDQIESLMTTVIETNYKLEELDKRLINNLTTVLPELQKQLLDQIKEENTGFSENHLKLQKKVKGNRVLMWMLFILQLLTLGGIAFIVLYLMDYIYF